MAGPHPGQGCVPAGARSGRTDSSFQWGDSPDLDSMRPWKQYQAGRIRDPGIAWREDGPFDGRVLGLGSDLRGASESFPIHPRSGPREYADPGSSRLPGGREPRHHALHAGAPQDHEGPGHPWNVHIRGRRRAETGSFRTCRWDGLDRDRLLLGGGRGSSTSSADRAVLGLRAGARTAHGIWHFRFSWGDSPGLSGSWRGPPRRSAPESSIPGFPSRPRERSAR